MPGALDIVRPLFAPRRQRAIPTLDGAYLPNDRLDALPILGPDLVHPDDIAVGADGTLVVSTQNRLLRLSGPKMQDQSVIAALGFTADIGPLETWGIEIADRKILVDTAMRTSVSGVYSAGDITEYPGKVRLISVGFGEAATAVNNAATYLDPDQPLFPGHSSDDPAGVGATAAH